MRVSQKLQIDFSTADVDSINKNFINAISETAELTGHIKTYKPVNNQQIHKPWFDNDCKYAKKRLKAALKLAKSASFNSASVSKYLNARQEYKNTLNSKATLYRNDIIDKFADVKNMLQFWRTYNSFNSKMSHSPPLGIDIWDKFYKNI